jgi:hypothetical protein
MHMQVKNKQTVTISVHTWKNSQAMNCRASQDKISSMNVVVNVINHVL